MRTWIPLAIAGGLLIPVLSASGGLAGRFSTRDTVNQAITASGAAQDTIRLYLLNRLPGAATLVGVYCAVFLWHRRRSHASTGGAALFLQMLIGLLLVVLLVNPYSSTRYAAFGAIMAVIFGLYTIDSRYRRTTVLATMTVGLLTVYPLASYFKKVANHGSPSRLGTNTYLSVDFDGYQQTVNTLSFVHTNGYAFGSHTLSALGFFIPRSIWSGKATPASLDIAASRGYPFTNLSLPLWSEFYLEFGLAGIVALMFLLGWISRRLDERYVVAPASHGAHLAVLFAAAQSGLIRGPLGGSVVTFGTVLILGALTFRGRNALAARLGTGPPPAAASRVVPARLPAGPFG